MMRTDYPFDYETCEHNKVFTDPDNIGVCMECIAINIALSGSNLVDMDAIKRTYAILAASEADNGQ